MKPPPDHFDDLQALLASRRHMQPPTGYLDRFSESVKEQIEHPEPPGPPTWRQRLGLDADWKPAIMCAWGVTLCSSLLIGIIVSLNLFQQPGAIGSPIGFIWGSESPFGAATTGSQAPVAAADDSSTDPIFNLSELEGTTDSPPAAP